MTSDCPWRYLTADGRVLRCVGHWQGADHWHEQRLPQLADGPGFGPATAWDDGDPCAFKATVCPDCNGTGHPLPCNATTPRQSCLACPQCVDEPADCLTCGGAGTVDTIPPSLVGPGSIVTPTSGHWQYGDHAGALKRMLVSKREGRWSTGLVSHRGEPGSPVTVVPDDLYGWRVLRAVPPATDQEDPT